MQKNLDYDLVFHDAIETLKKEGRYRVFADLERCVGEAPFAMHRSKGEIKKVTVWCSNDYLGMSHNPDVITAMKKELDDHGAGAGGTRNISGTHHTIVELEKEIASVQKKEAALVLSSGYVANEAALASLGKILKDVVILSDEENHASMIEGIRHSKAEKLVFKHNDCAHLESLLKTLPFERKKLIAFESVYAMSGGWAPMKEIVRLAKKYNAFTYVDETHAFGLYGPEGAGRTTELGLAADIDCIQGGLGKGCGVFGGFIAGSKNLVDVIRSYGSGFIFTTTIPPSVAAGALRSIQHIRTTSFERDKLFENVRATRKALLEKKLPVKVTESQIIPLVIGDSVLCKKITDLLVEDYGIYLQPINYPTVPRGCERIRITPNPSHTPELIEVLAQALEEIWDKLGLPHSPDGHADAEALSVSESSQGFSSSLIMEAIA